MNITISGDVVAWYGAIVATASAVFVAYAILRDRVKVKVSARPNMRLITVGGPQDDDETYIVIEVSNVGRRPVHLQRLPYFTLKGEEGGLVVKGDWAPAATIEEGRSASLFARQGSFTVGLDKLKGVCVRDETGRVWKGKVKKG